jgi:hypothetical protein
VQLVGELGSHLEATVSHIWYGGFYLSLQCGGDGPKLALRDIFGSVDISQYNDPIGGLDYYAKIVEPDYVR